MWRVVPLSILLRSMKLKADKTRSFSHCLRDFLVCFFPSYRGHGLVLVCVLLSQREFLTNMTLEYKPKKKK